MKIKKQKQTEREIIQVEHEDETLEFHFLPVLKTDCFFLVQSPNLETLAKWVLSNKLIEIHGVEFEDGSVVTPADAYDLPISLLFNVVAQYSEKIKAYSDQILNEQQPEKKSD